MLVLQGLWSFEEALPKRAAGQAGRRVVALPTTSVTINGFVVSDALVDTGSQVSLIDSRALSVVAPNVELQPPARLLSASGHQLNVLGTCTLSVGDVGQEVQGEPTEFTVVHDLLHNVILGWDFLSKHNFVFNCSPSESVKVKLRLKKAVSVPPHSAICMTVKVDQSLCEEDEYLFVGQRSNNIEICDALLKPFSAVEIPVYVRNRSDRLITIHRRSVIGYAERVEHVELHQTEPVRGGCMGPGGTGVAAEVNTVSADDGRFVGKTTDEVLSEFVVGSPITPSQRDKLAALLSSFPEVFSRGYADIGRYTGGDVDLELQEGARPQFIRPYPVPWARESQLRTQLDELQACGVLEQGEPSDWNSPIVLVSKGKGSNEYRIVQDMRCLNKLLVPKQFVFPTIDDFIFSLHGWTVASTLDIKHAFWNLQLSESSSKICAFYALGKTYYPRRMPMGCMQSSYFLHLAMRKVLGDLENVHVYADDILLTSSCTEEHYQLLHIVLERLCAAGFKLAPGKCRLFQTKLKYLGHQITPEGVSIDPDRTRIIADLQPPTSIKEAKRMFGFFSWFRKFVPSFSSISEPLVNLCNSEKFYWDQELASCFCSLRDILLSERVLSYPRRDCPFVLYTDSSSTGSGQILSQIQDGEERVIAFNGSRYSRAQRKWTIFELEVFSFITGLKKFFKYLADSEFTWVCDCKSALQILRNQDDTNSRLARWRIFVSQFRYISAHRRAEHMQHVDMLSRLHEPQGSGDSDVDLRDAEDEVPNARETAGPTVVSNASGGGGLSAAAPTESRDDPPAASCSGRSPETPEAGRRGVALNCDPDVRDPAPPGGPLTGHADGERGNVRANASGAVADAMQPSRAAARGSNTEPEGAREVNLTAADLLVQLSLKPESLVWYQKHDRNCRAMAHYLNHGKWPRFTPPYLKREPVGTFLFRDGILLKHQTRPEDRDLIVWPVAKRFELLYRHHDVSQHAHGGGSKLYELVGRGVWYPGLKKDCADYVRSCVRCSQSKSTGLQNSPLLPQEASYPNEVLIIDILSMPRSTVSGRCYLLTCVDKFSGFLTCYPLDSGSSDHIAQKLEYHFLTFGPPESLESDAGSNLVKNASIQTLCDYFGVKTRHSVGYHHEAVGKIERRHLDIKRRLRAVSESRGSDWEQRLPGLVFSLNNDICRTHGFSPFFIYFLRYPHSPISDLVSKKVSLYSDDYVQEKLRILSDTFEQARKTQTSSYRQYKADYDRRKRVNDQALSSGDQIWCRNFNAKTKMDDPWVGPFIVARLVGRRHVDYIDKKGVIRRTIVRYVKPVSERAV